MPGDKVYLVIWYKEGAITPIYSFDARGKSFDQARHWADEQTLGGRAYFRFTDDPAKLTVESVKDEDGGVYRCRVDFKKSPTRNTKVNLTVLIPPESLSIIDEKGTTVQHYIIGPYNEGSTVEITCIATGGRPTPRVTWWQENALLDDSFETISDKRVRNVLRLERLERRHLNTVYTCQASNNNLVAPISSAVTLDMNLRPLSVRLKGQNDPLSADNTYELVCEVVGARPEPVITWWKGSIPLKNTRERSSPDKNITTSTLTFVPTLRDSGKYLSCRAGVPLIADSAIEDGWRLNIHHVPIVTLELGSNLNASTIREGVDVYFECNIKSNPWVYKVSWRHNGKTLFNNASAGTIVSNQSLVLQSVTRSRAGIYTCVGSNQEGDGESNPVNLDVKFAPVCRTGQQKVYGVARQEAAKILCELEANPKDVSFIWKFNNTSEAIDIQQSHFVADRARSVATYTPMTELDYGTLLCWGRNELGHQRHPCVFHIIPAGRPDPVHNCSILNQTAESLHVECTEGFDGGLPQHFVMEVFDTQTHALVSNVTNRTPVFTVGGLESGLGFVISVYAANGKGRSDAVPLHAYTLKAAEKRTGIYYYRFLNYSVGPDASNGINAFAQGTILHITPILAVLVGVVAALVLVAVVIVVVMRLRGHDDDDGDEDDEAMRNGGTGGVVGVRGTRKGAPQTATHCTNGVDEKTPGQTLGKDICDGTDPDEKNPDIIPQNNDNDYQDADEKAFEKLNNTSTRMYETLPHIHPHSNHMDSSYDSVNVMNIPKMVEDITYAELALPKAHTVYAPPVSRRQEPTVYAQIDVSKKVPPPMDCSGLSQPQQLLLHHQHPPMMHPQTQLHMHLHQPHHPRPEDDEPPSVETPLMSNHRESTIPVPVLPQDQCRGSYQPGQRVVSATRF
ncbi:nephrin-like isoform X2 [Ischnura elegans]|uniref:nephrin-like isoform X2 n=1 Tax=Ischnura elegans TaxID=197161 RepID=UPI001ED88165|nr:nephrin-like isoform X2 [Ischnura elegans]